MNIFLSPYKIYDKILLCLLFIYCVIFYQPLNIYVDI